MKKHLLLLFCLTLSFTASGQIPIGGYKYQQSQIQDKGWITNKLDSLRRAIGLIGTGGSVSTSLTFETLPGKPIVYPSSIALVALLQERLNEKANLSVVYTKAQADTMFVRNGYVPLWDGIAYKPLYFPTRRSISPDIDTALNNRVTRNEISALLNGGVRDTSAYTKEQARLLFARKGSTLGDYGIANAFTKTEASALRDDVIRFSAYAINDSTSDNTAQLQNAINAAGGKTLLIEQTYRVNTNAISLLNDIVIRGPGKIKTTATSGNIFSATNKENISIEGLRFAGPNGDVKVLYTSNTKNVTIDRVKLSLLGLLRADNSQRFSITKLSGANRYDTTKATSKMGSVACVDLFFTSNVKVDSSYLTGYRFGVQFWGGDANPITQVSPEVRTPTALTVARGCTDIAVTNSTFKDMYAGFWGSMGRKIVADNVTTIRTRDVGIDYEGVINGKVTRSYVQDAEAGGLATFFLCDSIVWDDVETRVTLPGMRAFAIHNIGSNLSGSLTINKLRATSTIADNPSGYVTGGYRDLTFTNSELTNILADFSPVLGHNQKFENLTWKNTLTAGTSLRAGNVIKIGTEKGVVVIDRVRMYNQPQINSNTPAGFGIQLFHASDPAVERISNVFTAGYYLDLVLQPQANTTEASRTILDINDNVFGNGQVFVSPPTGSNLPLNIRAINGNNRHGGGNFIGGLGTYIEARTPVSIDLTGLQAGHVLQVNGSGVIVPAPLPAFGNVASIAGISGGSNAYAPILTLPASSGGSYDYSNLIVSLGAWGGTETKTLNLITGNRDGFYAYYTRLGSATAGGNLTAYRNADNSVTFYVELAPFQRASVTYLATVQSTPVTTLSLTGTAPTGTNVFSAATTSPTNVNTTTSAPAAFTGTAQIVFDGNSVVYGVGSTHTASNADDFTGNNFPAVARRALVSAFPGVTFTTKNFGVDGQTTPQMASDAATQIDAIFDGSFDRNILVVREISNDISLNNVSAATAYQTFVDFCQARRAKGWRVLFLTLTPRSVAPSTMTLTEYNNRKDAVNGLLRKNWPLFSDGIIDVATLSGLTFPDGVHTNDAGYAQYGALTATKVGAIVQNGFNPTSIPPVTIAATSSTTTAVTSSTLLVLNGTGTNGSTVIQDGSPYNRSVTNNGVTISTAQAKFGGSSLFFNGSADLDLGSSSDWNLGTGDFTMETWFYATSWSNPGTNPFFARTDGTQVQWTFNVRAAGASTALNVRTADNTGYLSPGPSNSTAAPALNSWHHYAVVSTGGARKLYIDGVLSATSTSFPSMETNTNSVPLKIGTLTSSDRLNGYGHFRFTKTALYSANFTPPTSF
jgi:lysophospholipase L1-like esterase